MDFRNRSSHRFRFPVAKTHLFEYFGCLTFHTDCSHDKIRFLHLSITHVQQRPAVRIGNTINFCMIMHRSFTYGKVKEKPVEALYSRPIIPFGPSPPVHRRNRSLPGRSLDLYITMLRMESIGIDAATPSRARNASENIL